jgi:hypothetical protein
MTQFLIVDELDVAGVLLGLHELELCSDPAERHAASDLGLALLSFIIEMGFSKVKHPEIVVV